MSRDGEDPAGWHGRTTMAELPAGTVTFLFTDIEGSTQLWEKHPQAMKAALAGHDSALKRVIGSNNGRIIKTTGDGVHAVFEKVSDAIDSTIAAQRELRALALAEHAEIQLSVRMGLHTGEAELRAGDYYGQSLNRAARIMSAGHGGQILLSSITADLAREHLSSEMVLVDLGEHRLKDLARAERIFQLSADGLRAQFPAIRSLDALPNNLPLQLTSFIGRENEIAEAAKKLFSTRLLTLIGPGGTGKTRLSVQLAADLLPSFSDGVWFVELAPLADPALVLPSIAKAFNIRAQLGMPLLDIVLNYVRAKHLLLILDNCEHLIEPCARLAEQLLQNSPDLKIIASSREALGINGEAIYRVPSLSLPDATTLTADTLSGYEAARLFIERARAANPKFEVTDVNASAIAQICNRLDGIPLAIELAAARSSVFSAEQIAARLDDRFKLLTGGSRTALPRQQTLRALIDWSYDILSEGERTLLRRLSVFAGGWTFEAAEAICADLDVLDLLAQLVNKSLVTAEEGPLTRYFLLETIRQYARDKLLDSGESEAARDLHMRHFVDFAETTAPRIDTQEVLKWIPKLDAEYDNFRSAFDWGLDNHMESCLRLVGALAYYWFRRGHGAEGIRMADETLSRAARAEAKDGLSTPEQMMIWARALQAISFLSYSQGDNKSAYRAAGESIALARQLGDDRMLATALAFSGSAKIFDGDHTGAVREVEEAVAIARKSGEKLGLGIALGMMAQVEMIARHDVNAAEAFEREAIALTADGGNTWAILMLHFATGRGAMFRGDYVTARERFAKCLPIFQEMKDEHRVNMIYSEFGHIDRYEGRYPQAEEAYRKTILVWEKLGHRAAIAHQFESFAFIAIAREQPERAARLLGAAEILRKKININMSPPELVEYQKEVAKLRAGMEEQSFESLWASGRAMSMEDAVAFAIQ